MRGHSKIRKKAHYGIGENSQVKHHLINCCSVEKLDAKPSKHNYFQSKLHKKYCIIKSAQAIDLIKTQKNHFNSRKKGITDTFSSTKNSQNCSRNHEIASLKEAIYHSIDSNLTYKHDNKRQKSEKKINKISRQIKINEKNVEVIKNNNKAKDIPVFHLNLMQVVGRSKSVRSVQSDKNAHDYSNELINYKMVNKKKSLLSQKIQKANTILWRKKKSMIKINLSTNSGEDIQNDKKALCFHNTKQVNHIVVSDTISNKLKSLRKFPESSNGKEIGRSLDSISRNPNLLFPSIFSHFSFQPTFVLF